MLGMSFLNEITKTKAFDNAASILEKLRQNIIDSLRQNETGFEQMDGMDMSLIILNDKNNTIEFAGARNPLYIITEKEIKYESSSSKVKTLELENINKKLIEIAADKMPVGKYLKMGDFKNHKITVNKGDQIVLFSDGMTDQFGSNGETKYQTTNFKSLLLTNSDKELNEQLAIIKDEFYNWKGETEQIDDVSILSFKI
jgi:Serine phosphatase RsbU, regulator of sigma subunit